MPAGIFQSTTPRPEPSPAEQGGDASIDDEAVAARPSKASKARKGKAPATGADKDGWKLYLSEDVRFRLRMLAFKRGQKLSTVANDVLDKALPRWSLERAD
ncbi:MAG: hypothetical protein JWN86_2520 [Planctomycetota bacterium]|nr:hypothetical protein [Planctomycetota bacterium]